MTDTSVRDGHHEREEREERAAPIPNSYWLPGGQLIAGEYPGSPDHDAAREKVRALLDAGVRVFVDLTESHELTPYDEIALDEAASRGVGLAYIRLPIGDMSVPPASRMAEVLERLDSALSLGQTAYVHCWGGVGRTGTVVGCWLVSRGWSADDALAEVGRRFATMSPAKRRRHPEGSPQTPSQREFVRRWATRERTPGKSRPARASAHASTPDVRASARGALIGLAVGDAVGTTVEFKTRGTFPPVTDMVGGGPFGLAAGQWTDDTSMALCLAESLLERGGFDAADQMRRYVRWWREGHLSSTGRCFDIGNTTSRSLASFERTGEPYSGSTDPRSAGNGSIMRLAPVPLFFANDPAAAIRACADSSRTTHGATVAVDACRYLGALLLGALAGERKETLLAPGYTPVPGYWDEHPLCPEIAAIAGGSFARKRESEIRGSGYAAESLEAALWAFHATESFRDGCLLAVNLGDDADTTAAVYGQIAGAYHGEEGVPGEWRERLALRDVMDNYADRLAARVAGGVS